MNSLFSALLALLSSCLLPTAPVPGAAQSAAAAGDFFPTPKQGLAFVKGGDSSLRLSELLTEFSRVTGQTIVSDDPTRRLLEVDCGLNQGVEIPPAQVYAFTESVLAYHGFALYHLRSEAPRLLGIMHPRAQSETSGAVKPLYVPLETLGAWKDHPAFLVQTMITLPNIDVRTLSNALRGMFTDNRTQQIIPLGNSNSLLVSGTAQSVQNLVAMLQRSDQEMSKAGAQLPPQRREAEQPAPAK